MQGWNLALKTGQYWLILQFYNFTIVKLQFYNFTILQMQRHEPGQRWDNFAEWNTYALPVYLQIIGINP